MLLAFASLATASSLPAQNLEWAEPAAPVGAEDGPVIEDEMGVPGFPSDPTPVPLDGGLTLLGAAGAAYAVRRLRQRRTSQSND